MKQDDGWGSRPVQGRDWGNSYTCNEMVIDTLVAEFEDSGRRAGKSMRACEAALAQYFFTFLNRFDALASLFIFQEYVTLSARRPPMQDRHSVSLGRQILRSTWKKTSSWSRTVSWMKPCSHNKTTRRTRRNCEGAKYLTRSTSECHFGHQRLRQVRLCCLSRNRCFVP